MKNTEIKYQLSTDYEKLYRLLKEGCKIIGFHSVGNSYEEADTDVSVIETFEYNAAWKRFYLNAVVAESGFTKEEILAYMARWNVRYFDLPESQTETLPDAEERPFEWMDISTAPKDGTKVLVCHKNYYNPESASFRTYHPNAKGKPEWRTDGMGTKLDPTHWAPLPPEPNQI